MTPCYKLFMESIKNQMTNPNIRFPPQEGMLTVSILFNNTEHQDLIEKFLISEFGPILNQSEIKYFDFTKYYDKEMGPNIQRYYLSFNFLVHPSNYYLYKLKMISFENKHRIKNQRQFNLDVGFVELDKFILLSTKPATYRIYLSDGIYAQSTYFYKDNTYQFWPWTYADYQTRLAIDFFNNVRNNRKNFNNLSLNKENFLG